MLYIYLTVTGGLGVVTCVVALVATQIEDDGLASSLLESASDAMRMIPFWPTLPFMVVGYMFHLASERRKFFSVLFDGIEDLLEEED